MDDGWTLVGSIVVIIAAIAVTFAAAAGRRMTASVEDDMQMRSLERDFRETSIKTISDDP